LSVPFSAADDAPFAKCTGIDSTAPAAIADETAANSAQPAAKQLHPALLITISHRCAAATARMPIFARPAIGGAPTAPLDSGSLSRRQLPQFGLLRYG
jgi:hypothetical protein